MHINHEVWCVDRTKLNQRALRCFVTQQDDATWFAICIDFELGAIEDTLKDAKQRLEVRISEYIRDSLEGEDIARATKRLSRKAPLGLMVWYQYVKVTLYFAKMFHQFK